MLSRRFSLGIDSYSFLLSDEITHLLLHVVLFPLRWCSVAWLPCDLSSPDEFKASCDVQTVQVSVVVISVPFSTFCILSRLQFLFKKRDASVRKEQELMSC